MKPTLPEHVKMYICTSCHHPYPDQPVTSCDCMPKQNDFREEIMLSAETVQRLIDEAYAAGLEDAAKPTQATEKYGCHCDLDDGMEPDGCVLDYGKPEDCVYARLRGSKDKCEYWKPIEVHKEG